MNITDAKAIPLDDFLQRRGYEVAKIQGGRKWYRYRNEKTASFVLSRDGMVSYDHGDGDRRGGNIIDLAMLEANSAIVADALALIGDTMGDMRYDTPIPRQRLPMTPEPPVYTLISAKPFTVRGRRNWYTPAAQYLAGQRGIEPEVFAPYLSDLVYAGKDGKKRYGFGVPNVGGGYEARRSGDFEKLSVGPKNIIVSQSSRERWYEAP